MVSGTHHQAVTFQSAKYKLKKSNTNNQMKKQLLFIALLFGAMLIAGTIDESNRQLEQQPNHYSK